MALCAFAALGDDSYLYWMIGDDETEASFTYNTVKVRAKTEEGASSYLNLYYGNGVAVGGTSVSKDDATSGLPFYASLAGSAGSSYSYVVELFNDSALVGLSSTLLYSDAIANSYVATVTSTGTFPAMATWEAGSFVVPEPNSAILLLLGCAAMLLKRRI